MERILRKIDFQKFLDNVWKTHEIIGPTKKGGGTSSYSHTTFGPLQKIEDLKIDYKSSMLSPKIIFFPDNQTLYQYEKKDKGINLEDLREVWDREKVLLGLHPCDITALSRLDKVFMDKGIEDPVYRDKRDKSIVVGLTCSETRKSCFCGMVGAGPDITEGYDALMTDLGDRYFFRAETKKGQDLISRDYFEDATDKDRNMRKEKIEEIRNILAQKIDLENVMEVTPEKYNDEMWSEFSEMCLTCGACNMVCPTCHCFAINDKTNWDHSRGKRVLVWDSCHFERFARMAGDLNTREEKRSRFKHRFYDKFHYDAKRSGAVFCVGCGRCLEFCPSHIDIRDALNRIQEG